MSKPKVLVALSGGVDSTAAAWLLQQAGHEVEGVFFTFYDPDPRTLETVQAVAERLDIKLYLPDYRDRFRQTVIQNFLDEYCTGRTPNPCVLCNPTLKFPLLAELANEINAPLIATGHYARVQPEGDFFQLYRGADSVKDQSYFLYRLPQHILARLVFPLGEVASKDHTRALLDQAGFAKIFDQKPESQDFCFLGERTLPEMLRENLPAECFRRGEIVSTTGEVLGFHEGLVGYTPGQRKGLQIGGNGPWFVLRTDFAQNRLIVGRETELFTTEVLVNAPTWCGVPPADGAYTAQIRYRSLAQPGTLTLAADDTFCFHFSAPQRSVTPGQSLVLYQSDRCVGGGIIQSTL